MYVCKNCLAFPQHTNQQNRNSSKENEIKENVFIY